MLSSIEHDHAQTPDDGYFHRRLRQNLHQDFQQGLHRHRHQDQDQEASPTLVDTLRKLQQNQYRRTTPSIVQDRPIPMTTDTPMTDAASTTPPPPSDPPRRQPKLKPKPKPKPKNAPSNAGTTIVQHTLHHPQWTYLHLTLHTTPPSSSSSSSIPPLDPLTARTHLTSALQQFLGLTGTAIPLDLLKLEGRDVWVRVPREDGGAFAAAVSGWAGADGRVGWRVRGRADWLGALVGGGGGDLFED